MATKYQKNCTHPRTTDWHLQALQGSTFEITHGSALVSKVGVTVFSAGSGTGEYTLDCSPVVNAHKTCPRPMVFANIQGASGPSTITSVTASISLAGVLTIQAWVGAVKTAIPSGDILDVFFVSPE